MKMQIEIKIFFAIWRKWRQIHVWCGFLWRKWNEWPKEVGGSRKETPKATTVLQFFLVNFSFSKRICESAVVEEVEKIHNTTTTTTRNQAKSSKRW